MKKLTLLVCLAFVAVFAKAQAPDSINYQAIARNSAGAELANKTISVKFVIHNITPTNLPALYTDIHPTVTTNVFGLFTTYIGVSPPGLSSINWASAGA